MWRKHCGHGTVGTISSSLHATNSDRHHFNLNRLPAHKIVDDTTICQPIDYIHVSRKAGVGNLHFIPLYTEACDCASTWWRHQMETFSALMPFCEGNSPVTGQWRGALMFSLICAWTNGWVNHRDAGDLRRNYDVTVMIWHHRHRISLKSEEFPPPFNSLRVASCIWSLRSWINAIWTK